MEQQRKFSQKKKRTVIDLNTKLNVLSQHASGKKCKNIALDLGLRHTTIYSIIKDKERITEAIKEDVPMKSTAITKHRTGPIHEMEKLLFAWIEEQNKQNIPLNTRVIKDKALTLFSVQKEKAGPECDVQFIASSGWLNRFNKRFDFAPHKLKNSIHKQEFEPPETEQQFIMEGISSVLQDRMYVDDYMMPDTNNIAHEADNGNKRIKISKKHYDTVSNTSDSDDGYVYVNPQQLMQVCLKEENPPNTMKIEPSDISEEAQIDDENKESPSEDTQATSDSHTDPLTVSKHKTLLSRDTLNSCNSVLSPEKFIESNIGNHSNNSTKSINDKLDLIGKNISMISNSLNSPKSVETVKQVIPSASTTLSSGDKRSQPYMSFKSRSYSLCEDSESINQQVVHAEGNSIKVCCCPEIHKEFLKLEREESNLRCQLLEEERVACNKEHKARMRLIAMEEELVQMQLRKLQSEIDERKNMSNAVDQNIGEQKNISIDNVHSNENDQSSSKHTLDIMSNTQQRLQELNDDSDSKSNIFDTIYVS